MRFGRTLRASIYPPWKDQYIDYSHLKALLRDDKEDDAVWTGEDEGKFCDDLFNVQLEKVAKFQGDMVTKLRQRVDAAFDQLREITPSQDDEGKGKERSEITAQRVKEIQTDLDDITNELRALKKYSNINYTAFLKIVKKHDRKRGNRYKIHAMMQIRLARRPFNSELGYAPLLTKLSVMFEAIRQYLHEDDVRPVDLESQPEEYNGGRYTAHKYWVHPDDLLEVKTMILRRLPTLVYSDSSTKEADATADPTLTSLYFDNSDFELYTNKVERTAEAASLRLRWYGQLSSKPEIFLEQKMVHDSGISEEQKFIIKDKYIKSFLDGGYKMEKTIQKLERQGQCEEEIEDLKSTAVSIRDFIKEKQLEPLLRANYTRTAFQKPADDRVRISVDTNLAFIREDVLDQRRPVRDPGDWHRRDIDNRNLVFPFQDLPPSDISRFPFAVLEIKLKEDNRKRASWVEDLMASHLLHSVPRFSKFVHGVATLFDDYVNRLPFWLSDLESDIRRDPQTAFEEEEQRKAQRAEDELVVGSLLGTKLSSFKPSRSSPVTKSYLADKLAREAAISGVSRSYDDRTQQGVGAEEGEAGEQGRNYGTLSSVLPSFSLTRYAKWRRARETPHLPEGVVEPTEWIKNAGPLQIEPKVWLANERTFLKWQHICILLGGLSVALYTAAGRDSVALLVAAGFMGIAIFTGAWGRYMLEERRGMIIARSGRDFDNLLGPMVISFTLMVALVLNFVFAYRAAFERWNKEPVLLGAVTNATGSSA